MAPRKSKRVLIIDGHPDPRRERLCHQLTQAYAGAAAQAGHDVRVTRIADLEFPWLRTSDEYRRGKVPAVIKQQQDAFAWAQHVVVIFPLWLGTMPALLKGYFEQVLRPGFAFGPPRKYGGPKGLLAGRSARVIVTMGGPAMYYRLADRAHGLKGFERNILRFVGLGPVRDTTIGEIDDLTPAQWQAWVDEIREFARSAR
jgi:putative NADPH-quinone reductase